MQGCHQENLVTDRGAAMRKPANTVSLCERRGFWQILTGHSQLPSSVFTFLSVHVLARISSIISPSVQITSVKLSPGNFCELAIVPLAFPDTNHGILSDEDPPGGDVHSKAHTEKGFPMCLRGSSFDFLAVDTRVRCQRGWASPKTGLATLPHDLRLPAIAGRGPLPLMPY